MLATGMNIMELGELRATNPEAFEYYLAVVANMVTEAK